MNFFCGHPVEDRETESAPSASGQDPGEDGKSQGGKESGGSA